MSPNVISVDCLVDRTSVIGERTFYVKTGMVLLAPLFFIGGIALFWMLRYYISSCTTSSKQEKFIRQSASGTSPSVNPLNAAIGAAANIKQRASLPGAASPHIGSANSTGTAISLSVRSLGASTVGPRSVAGGVDEAKRGRLVADMLKRSQQRKLKPKVSELTRLQRAQTSTETSRSRAKSASRAKRRQSRLLRGNPKRPRDVPLSPNGSMAGSMMGSIMMPLPLPSPARGGYRIGSEESAAAHTEARSSSETQDGPPSMARGWSNGSAGGALGMYTSMESESDRGLTRMFVPMASFRSVGPARSGVTSGLSIDTDAEARAAPARVSFDEDFTAPRSSTLFDMKVGADGRRASGDEAALHAAGFSVVEIADLKVRAAAITTKSSTWSHTVDRILVSCIVVGFLIHSTVSKASLQLFTCIEIGGMARDASLEDTGSDTTVDAAPERSVLLYDMEVTCDSRLSFAA